MCPHSSPSECFGKGKTNKENLCSAKYFCFLENTELFSEKCCAKKNVGGIAYTQVPGDTTDFPTCKPGCVYELDNEPGSRYCFSTGNINTDKPVMCTG